jgi:nucleotide-binding universal stress UspA family protein
MKKILVPTDFSDCAEKAVITAANLASASGASLILLHSVDTPVDWTKLPKNKEKDFPETLAKIANAKDQFNKLCKLKELKKLQVETFLAYNIAHADIIKYTKELKAEIVVMGTHGSSGINELWLGSNTQRIVRMSPVPVVSIKNNIVKPQIKKIIFATNFEEEVGKPFKQILDFAHSVNAAVELLYINTPADFRDNSFMEIIMNDFAADYPKRKFQKAIWNDFTVEEGIINYAKKSNADMVAMITHGSARLFNTSIAEKVVNRSPIPVMSMNIFKA